MANRITADSLQKYILDGENVTITSPKKLVNDIKKQLDDMRKEKNMQNIA